MTTFNFNDRDTYLTFRSEWKKEYMILSHEIRGLKALWTEEVRSGKVGPNGTVIYSLLRKRREANAMMQILEEAKLESARQWAASLEGAVA